MARNLYDVLGVARDASDREIRQAYRRLARQYHPDVNPGDATAEERFKEGNRAYEVLSSADSRAKYDRYGDQWEQADRMEQMRRGGGAQPFEFGDVGDLFGGLGREGRQRGGALFESLLRRASGRQRGQDVEHTVRVSLEEAYAGTKRTVEVRGADEHCRVCGGEGTLAGATCHACRGSGVAAPLRRIEVTVPAGVSSGTRIRVAGKGGPGAHGASAGDLFLRVEVRAHPAFERRGDDLHVDVDVPVEVAALGGEAQVRSLGGRMLALRIPEATQGGRTFRLAGQGMPGQNGGFGDLHARVRLVLPEHLSEEQRDLFERLARSNGRRAGAAGEADGDDGEAAGDDGEARA